MKILHDCTKKLEDTHNFIFSNSIDPSTLLHATELSSDITVTKKNKIQYFFAHLAFPLANQLYKMKVVAKRIHIPLRLLADKFVVGLVQSAATILSGTEEIKFFLHPQQIKQVIHDMLVIMTGLVSEDSTEYYGNNTMKYRCSMFLGDINEEGELANGYPSLYDANDKSEMFWKGSNKRVQFSDETKQRQYMNSFFQILNPNSVAPTSDTQGIDLSQKDPSYDFHGNGWFSNMCWNHVSIKHSESRNDALKNWALAVVWQQLERDTMQDSLLYPGDENRIEFRHFDSYCRDAVTFMKNEMNIDSSDDELDSEMDSIISAKLYRFQAVTQRFPAAQGLYYCIYNEQFCG